VILIFSVTAAWHGEDKDQEEPRSGQGRGGGRSAHRAHGARIANAAAPTGRMERGRSSPASKLDNFESACQSEVHVYVCAGEAEGRPKGPFKPEEGARRLWTRVPQRRRARVAEWARLIYT
jgi:hypothetical protein